MLFFVDLLQAPKLELHKNESFQFGNLCPESAEATEVVGTVVHENGQELVKAGEKASAVETVHEDYQNATKSWKTITRYDMLSLILN